MSIIGKSNPDFTRQSVIPQIQVTLNCNLDCAYCFQRHDGKFLDTSTVKKILEEAVAARSANCLSQNNDRVHIYWHGGEPLLAGVEFFQKVIEMESRFPGVTFENRVQTNGTLMSHEFAAFFAENRFSVGFSLDGPEYIHNLHRRLFKTGEGSFDATMKGIQEYIRCANPGAVAVIAVITRASLDRVREIYEFFKDLGAKVQLDIFDIRVLDLLRSSPDHASMADLAPSPEEVGRFLIDLFDLWFFDGMGRVDFNELKNETKMILQPEFEGGEPYHKKRCDFRRLIFDPHGRAYSCDQYINDERTSLGDIHKDSLQEIIERKIRLWEEIKLHVRRSGDKMACAACRWGRRHGGGCITCMKYNALLNSARSQGLPDHLWYEAELTPPLKDIPGETYYCDGLRAFRRHVEKVLRRELSDV